MKKEMNVKCNIRHTNESKLSFNTFSGITIAHTQTHNHTIETYIEQTQDT